MEGKQNTELYSQRTQNQIEKTIRNLNEDYRKLNANHEKYFSILRGIRRGNLLLDTNLFIPLSGDMITSPLVIDNWEDHRIYSLSEKEILESAISYKRCLRELLLKTPRLYVTKKVYLEAIAETGYWQGRIDVLDNFKLKIMDNKRRDLLERLIKIGKSYLSYLIKNHEENRELIKSKIILGQNGNYELEERLKQQLAESHVNCTDVDRDLVFHAFVNGFMENLTLISLDAHIQMLMEDLLKYKKEFETIADKKIKIRGNKFWHGYTTYIFDFIERERFN